MRRRQFISLMGAAGASAWAHAQSEPRPIIGYISPYHMRWQLETDHLITNLQNGMRAEGWRYDHFEKFIAERFSQLDELAAAMVARPASLIYAMGPTAALAALRKTSTIPIVYVVGGDPVAMRLAKSLRRPEGNATGVSLMSGELAPKRLEVLLEIVPTASRIAILFTGEADMAEIRNARAAAHARNIVLDVVDMRAAGGFEASFAAIGKSGAQALMIASEHFFLHWGFLVIARATKLGIPVIYPYRQFVSDGGLLSYGPLLADTYFDAGRLGARILLKGARPGELPIMQPRRFDLAINRKTAQSVGLNIPTDFLARADLVLD